MEQSWSEKQAAAHNQLWQERFHPMGEYEGVFALVVIAIIACVVFGWIRAAMEEVRGKPD